MRSHSNIVSAFKIILLSYTVHIDVNQTTDMYVTGLLRWQDCENVRVVL